MNAPACTSRGASGAKRILVIDDDEAVLMYLSSVLGADYCVTTAADPLKGLESAQQSPPDLVICDLDMPRMSGGALAAELAHDASTAELPVLFLTSLICPTQRSELTYLVDGRPGVAKASGPEVLKREVRRLLDN